MPNNSDFRITILIFSGLDPVILSPAVIKCMQFRGIYCVFQSSPPPNAPFSPAFLILKQFTGTNTGNIWASPQTRRTDPDPGVSQCQNPDEFITGNVPLPNIPKRKIILKPFNTSLSFQMLQIQIQVFSKDKIQLQFPWKSDTGSWLFSLSPQLCLKPNVTFVTICIVLGIFESTPSVKYMNTPKPKSSYVLS